MTHNGLPKSTPMFPLGALTITVDSSLSISLSFSLSPYFFSSFMSVCLPVFFSHSPSIYLSIYLSIFLSISFLPRSFLQNVIIFCDHLPPFSSNFSFSYFPSFLCLFLVFLSSKSSFLLAFPLILCQLLCSAVLCRSVLHCIFSSEWSYAQVRGLEGQFICAFDKDSNRIVVRYPIVRIATSS